jgi:hypothetical protein
MALGLCIQFIDLSTLKKIKQTPPEAGWKKSAQRLQGY